MKVENVTFVHETLKKQDEVAFLTRGASMHPLLRSQKDVVIIKKAAHPLKVADVPLYKKQGTDKLILHRIIKVLPDGNYITRGDNTYHREYVSREDVVGVMTAFIRNDKYVNCNSSKLYRVYVCINRFFYPLRWIWHTKIRKFLSRIKNACK